MNTTNRRDLMLSTIAVEPSLLPVIDDLAGLERLVPQAPSEIEGLAVFRNQLPGLLSVRGRADAHAGEVRSMISMIAREPDQVEAWIDVINALTILANAANLTLLLLPVRIGFKGTQSAVFLKGLAQKTRRGMAGVIRQGRHAGGRAYGYKAIPGAPGELTIVDSEAEIVRRIFADYVAGKSPRAIAGELNAEGIPPPRGTYWAAITLNGNRKRGHGILLNPLYVGRLVWNRVRMVKDPETGNRISRVNPEAEWQEQAVPALAIVENEMFAAALAKRGGRAAMAPRDRSTPRHLLSGLLRCGSCGAGMSVKDHHRGRTRIRCTKATESGSCDNIRAYQLNVIETAVVGGLSERMVDRDGIALYVRVYNEERQALAADSVNRRARIEKRLAQAEREQDRVYKAFVMGLIEEDQVKRELPPRKAECEALRAELALCDEPPNVVSLHPATVSRYLASIESLERTVREGEAYGAESKKALRDLISTVTVYKAPAGVMPEIEVTGHLTNLIGGDHFPTSKAVGGRMVAGEGLATLTHSNLLK